MKKFYTVLKVKENELANIQKTLHKKDVEIGNITSKSIELENKTKNMISLTHTTNNYNSFELHALIDKSKTSWIKLEEQKSELERERELILSELLTKKQELKSIEMLITKKKLELKAEEEKKEQNLLDELNSIE